MATLRIGTRGSRLAIWQAAWVKRRLEERYSDMDARIVSIKTMGDKILDVPLAKVGGKGLFVKEIEIALIEGDVDLAVHSMKDVPTRLMEELAIVAVTEREDPRDAVVGNTPVSLLELPAGSRIGTSSLRRQAQILAARPDFEVLPLRGNLNTRMRKLREGDYDAIILAMAGIKRLELEGEVTEVLDIETMLPAIGQGALGIETRVDDEKVKRMVSFLDHEPTRLCVASERSFLHRLEGGCQVPVAAHGRITEAGRVVLEGLVADVNGTKVIRLEGEGGADQVDALGRDLADRILDAGGRQILEALYCRELG